jgi:Kef-type K+ transport system membrane component KefB/Trk K+ transport system NAD-binding subunit
MFMNLSPLLAGPPEDPTRFVQLLIVLGLAFLIPVLLARFQRLPVVVGEIVFGVLVGPSLLQWVTEGSILNFMSDIGLAFLMFLAGMEIEFDLIFGGGKKKTDGPNVLGSSLLIYVFTLILSVLGALLVQHVGIHGDLWLIVFVLSATSLGVLLPILKDRGLLSTPFGQVVFLTAMLADFITVILLTVHLIMLDKGFDLEIFSLALLFIAFLIFYKIGLGLVRRPMVRNLIDRLSSATVQIKVRGAIAILIAFVVLAEFVDAELILGAFLAGMIISLLRRPEDEGLIHNLEAFGFGFFIPIFFIMVGVGLDIQALLSSPELLVALPAFLGIALVIKILPMLVVKRHFSWRDLFAGGFLLNTHLSLEVAVAVIGLRAGLFDQATSTIVIVFAILTVLLMPLFFGMLAPDTPEKEQPYHLIFGATNLGITVAQQLRAHGDKIQFIFLNPTEKQALTGTELPFLEIEIEKLETLNPASIRSALILHDNDLKNLELARIVRAAGIRAVIAKVTDPQHLPKFDAEGVKTFSPALERATMVSMMARNPDVLALLTTTSEERAAREMIVSSPKIAGRKLRDLKLPGDLLILAIRRNRQLLIPRGNTSFEIGDRVSLLGGHDSLSQAQELFER